MRMTLHLDPRFPVVWRTPTSLQIGIDRPLAVIEDVSAGLERVVAALRAGVPRIAAVMLGREAGVSASDVERLLRELAPALIDSPHPAPLARHMVAMPAGAVCVDGVGPTADRIRSQLTDLGIPIGVGEDRDLAVTVLVGHYVVEPRRHGRWLRRDIPHVPVIFSDGGVRFGPFVEPGTGPCLSCLDLARVDRDIAWPAVAVQLLTRKAPTETPRATLEVATWVTALVDDRLRRGATTLSSVSIVRDAETGNLRRYEHQPHALCGCRSLPGTGNPPAGSAAARRLPPNLESTDDVPA
ncbi:MAG: hypothetical protein JWQ68_2225 [Cryobacterium sp.]|nr:hypothetical protein [Cryobacterium sp.]